jgi:hypothetical protein
MYNYVQYLVWINTNYCSFEYKIDYRLNKNLLLEIMEEWNRVLRRKVHLIACGGTAMTLLGVKPSTKDVDFMTPDLQEYAYSSGERGLYE